MLIDELKKEPNTPEFQDGEGDKQYLFTRKFVLMVTRYTHKYHMIMNNLLKKQNEDSRLAAIEINDDLEYARTYYSKDLNIMKTATEIEDIIFDYFGIVECQFEAANQCFKSDTTFTEDKTKLREEVKATVDEEYGLDDSEKLKTLDNASAQGYLTKIKAFTEKVIQEFTAVDQSTGRRVIQMNDKRFEIMHQKEKDKFYLETGFQPEQISKFMRQKSEAESAERDNKLASLAQHLETKKMSVTKIIENGQKDEENDDWEDVADDADKKQSSAKTKKTKEDADEEATTTA